MSSFEQSFKVIESSFLRILDTANTACCTVYCRTKHKTFQATYHKPTAGKAQPDRPTDKKPLFQMASLFKVFIAASLSLIIEKLSVDPPANTSFWKLKDAWDKRFTEVFNELFKDEHQKMDRLPGDPSLLQMLVHYNGVYDMNHILLAPDGTPLQGLEGVAKMISRYAQDTGGKDGKENSGTSYSNANFILLALMVDKVSGSLSDFLKEYILVPFKMDNTFLSVNALHMNTTEAQRQPHVVSSDGNRRCFRPGEILGLANVVELALLGPYISATDLARFLWGLQSALRGESVGLFDSAVVKRLGWGKSSEGDQQTGYQPWGLRTTLNSTGPGMNSINRLMWPENDHIPGETSAGEDIIVFYLAGSATGWAHTIYCIPERNALVMALTSSSGPLDASDLITMLCLQDMFELRPPKIDSWKASRSRPERSTTPSPEEYSTHYVEYAATIFRQISPKFKKFEVADDQPNTLTSTFPDLVGKYSCPSSGQDLEITDTQVDDTQVDGLRERVLRVTLKCGMNSSKKLKLWLAVKRDTFRICTSEECPVFAIDRFTSWENLEFKIHIDRGCVKSVSRQGMKLTDVFTKK